MFSRVYLFSYFLLLQRGGITAQKKISKRSASHWQLVKLSEVCQLAATQKQGHLV